MSSVYSCISKIILSFTTSLIKNLVLAYPFNCIYSLPCYLPISAGCVKQQAQLSSILWLVNSPQADRFISAQCLSTRIIVKFYRQFVERSFSGPKCTQPLGPAEALLCVDPSHLKSKQGKNKKTFYRCSIRYLINLSNYYMNSNLLRHTLQHNCKVKSQICLILLRMLTWFNVLHLKRK